MSSTLSPSSSPAPAGPAAPRLESLDGLRGLVMVLMALDHVRDYFHWSAIHGHEPLDLASTTPWIFLTRWVTHFCAPTFMFLAGIGAYLAGTRGRSKRALSRFLVSRGLWLILLELTFVNWAWTFSFSLHFNWALVLWALGWSMVVLAGLIHLPLPAIAALGGVLVLGHNALDSIRPEAFGSFAWLWHVLHVPGTIHVAPAFDFWVLYPLVPWIGVMALGYAAGPIYRWSVERRSRWLWRAGACVTAGFVLLRLTNLYGNLTPWAAQPRGRLYTLLSFLDVSKYPPSLCYLLATLGPALLALAWLERPAVADARWLGPLRTFGRVPFFYYLLHIPLLHGVATAIGRLRFAAPGPSFASDAPPPHPQSGFSLLATYGFWLAIVAALYPACRWFAALKRRRRHAWLGYF